jgi:hypothetical protein
LFDCSVWLKDKVQIYRLVKMVMETKTKPNIIVEIIGIVPVAVSASALIGWIVPRTATFLCAKHKFIPD